MQAASHIHDNEVTVGTSHIPGWRVNYNVLGHCIIDTNLVTSGQTIYNQLCGGDIKGNRDITNNAGNAQFISSNKMKSYSRY